MRTEPTRLAWCAGFIDGEGYIGLTRAKDKKHNRYWHRIQLDVANTQRASIEYIHDTFGGTVLRRENGFRGVWNVRYFGERACEILRALMPYLIIKRKQAELVLEFQATIGPIFGRGSSNSKVMLSEDIYRQREALWAALVMLNGGRALRAERLNERGPLETMEHAIVQSASNNEDAEVAEMTTRQLKVVG